MRHLRSAIATRLRRFGCSTAALLAAAALPGCSRDAAPPAKAPAESAHRVPDSSAGTVDLRSEPYHVGPVVNGGALVGKITLEGSATTDSLDASKDQLCANVPRDRAAFAGNATGTVVVWIADVKTGKALPVEKRYEIDSEDCQLDPPVQAAVTGSTFNVYNEDRVLHRLVFTRIGTQDTLTTMPFFNEGQLVATEQLAKRAGLVEARCLNHPQMRAYIAVFDHPYYAVTNADGSFKIDSLPAGNYKAMVWHPGLAQPVERAVAVTAGAATQLDVALKRSDR
jgi:hypothetical protein